jgi:hypothetical protein
MSDYVNVLTAHDDKRVYAVPRTSNSRMFFVFYFDLFSYFQRSKF